MSKTKGMNKEKRLGVPKDLQRGQDCSKDVRDAVKRDERGDGDR